MGRIGKLTPLANDSGLPSWSRPRYFSMSHASYQVFLDVGRSCVIVTLEGRNIMFDCGMHMGYNDERRFPDFTLLSPNRDFDGIIDCVIVTHFHLDHCGALPYFTEMCGYNGPVFMTHPTKALCPILLEDYRKITVDRKGESNFFTAQHIKQSMDKVKALDVHESFFLAPDFEIKAYYAGHVLGAAMFYVRVGGQSVVYTGDFNMTPDRHLGAAWIDQCKPDVLITESTYAMTTRESKRGRERDFLKKVHQAVAGGGKVIIPVFALGRVQELCILIETYWDRMSLGDIPVYFSAGMAETATEYYKQYLGWTNESIQRTASTERNPFDFKYIKPFEKHLADIPGPMVLFSTPGMLHSGTSLEVFKKWAPDAKNMVIIPGYCVAGTVGAKVLAGAKSIELDSKTKIDVNLQVKNLSFSAHADAKGIMQLIKNCKPANVVLVHGEANRMIGLSQLIKRQFEIPCYAPANGEMILIKGHGFIPMKIDPSMAADRLREIEMFATSLPGMIPNKEILQDLLIKSAKARSAPISFTGYLCWTEEDKAAGRPPRILRAEDVPDFIEEQSEIQLEMPQNMTFLQIASEIMHAVTEYCFPVKHTGNEAFARQVKVALQNGALNVSWPVSQEDIAHKIIERLRKCL